MATGTATRGKGSAASTDVAVPDEAPAGILADMEVEETLSLPARGRGTSADVIAIRGELEKMLTDNTARSFKNVESDEKEVYSRKVRAAGKLKTDAHGEVIETATRYDKLNKKLLWGPKSVLDALSTR